MLAVALVACARKTPPAPERATEATVPVVARVGDVEITVAELKATIEAQPPAIKQRNDTPTGRKMLVERLVRAELLAREARRRRGLEQSPELRRLMKQQLVNVLVKGAVDDRLGPEAISDVEIARYYETHTSEFNRPEEVRVSQIVVPRSLQSYVANGSSAHHR